MKNATFRSTTVAVDERYSLQPVSIRHAGACFASCQDPDIHRWLPLPRPYTRAFAEAWCGEMAEGFRLAGLGIHFAICEEDSMVGCISFKNVRWKEDVVEVGYWLDASARGQGIATRAVSALVNVAFSEGFQRVEMRIAEGNAPSIAVAERAGFVLEGVLRMGGVIHGGRVNLRMYSLLMSDVFH
ncbi:GNAT family N-acetyltransferase [Microbacterium sp.]|uniref:GNAT family N-acetyltransferase n=1 Tax=Microbacterium sp. TaxID=51671 RepID=UPI003566B3F1